jgi:hypothetical protein
VAKSVEFTCFNQGRIAEHYVEKANKGQVETDARPFFFVTDDPNLTKPIASGA